LKAGGPCFHIYTLPLYVYGPETHLQLTLTAMAVSQLQKATRRNGQSGVVGNNCQPWSISAAVFRPIPESRQNVNGENKRGKRVTQNITLIWR